MLKGYVFILSATLCWSLIGIFSSLAFSQGLDPMEVAFWRAVVSWLFFATQAIYYRETSIAKKDFSRLAAFAFLGISLFYISYQYTVKMAGVALASVLLYTAPAWVVICSFFIYRERLTLFKTAAVIMVITGVFMISKSGGNIQSQTNLGLLAIIAGLASGFCYSLYYTIGKYFSGRYSSANLFLWLMPLGAVGILPLVPFVHKTPIAWTAILGLAFISTFLANACYYQGLRHLEAGRASIVATMEPVMAAVTAYIFLGEYFSVTGYIGAGIIILSVVLTIVEK